MSDIFDFGDGFVLRPALAEDHAALRMICLRTGDSGQDATGKEDDPTLLGTIYAVPYAVRDPGFSFLLERPDGPVGYVLGAPDTVAFNRWLDEQWFEAFRPGLRDPGEDETRWCGSDWARRLILTYDPAVPEGLRDYPAHGHIDLLPQAQGRGLGRRMMEVLFKRLRADGVPALHLGVSTENPGAQAFYARLGFERLSGGGISDGAVFLGLRL